jgi:hypothetical protein
MSERRRIRTEIMMMFMRVLLKRRNQQPSRKM